MNLIRTIIQLLQKGFSARQISKELHLSRNTVRVYVDRFNTSGFNPEQLQKMDEAALSALAYTEAKQLHTDSRKEHFISRINYFLLELQHTGVTRHLLWDIHSGVPVLKTGAVITCLSLSLNKYSRIDSSKAFDKQPLLR
jgi:transposase